jgi:AcrR family transcriptional regulator
MIQQALARHPARENRQGVVLDAAAALFSKKGYEGTSLRDIAAASGMQAGSIYCHFSSKADIFLSVQREGIRQLIEAVESAAEGLGDPWRRLEAACAAHAKTLLDESDFAAVLLHVTPSRNLDLWDQLAALRDEYEDIFRQLVDDLPLPIGSNRKYLRLAILGTLNWSHHWYRPGRDNPEEIAAQMMRLFETQLREPV